MAYRKNAKNTFPSNPDVETVWAASIYADRMNNGVYVKYDEPGDNRNTLSGIIAIPKTTSNKAYIKNAVADTSLLTADDIEGGKAMRAWVNTLSFQAITRSLNDFEKVMLEVSASEDWSGNANYHLAIIASMPASYARGKKRDEINSTIGFSGTKHFGTVGERLELSIKILRSSYSSNWETNFVTAQTLDSNIVYFAYKEDLAEGKLLAVRGTIKAHQAKGQTQLKRVFVK